MGLCGLCPVIGGICGEMVGMNRERSGASHDPRRRVPRHWQLLARYHPPGWHLEFNPIRFSPVGSSRSATCDTTGHVSPDGTTIALDRAGGETHHSGPRLPEDRCGDGPSEPESHMILAVGRGWLRLSDGPTEACSVVAEAGPHGRGARTPVSARAEEHTASLRRDVTPGGDPVPGECGSPPARHICAIKR